MARDYSLIRTARFERHAKKLTRRHKDFLATTEMAYAMLLTDPRNETGKRYPITKLANLTGTTNGEWRLKLGKFRFRYDVIGDTVLLQTCFYRSSHDYKD